MAINEGNEAPPELTPSEPEKRGEYPIPSATCAKVLLDYTPEGEYSLDQLKLLAGDVVYVHEKHPSGWWGGHKAGSNSTGWFPASILQPYIAQRIGEWADDEAQDPPTSPGAAGLLLASMPTATASTSASMKSPLCTDDRPVASPQGLAQAVRLSRKGSTGSAETTELQTRSSQTEKHLEVEQQAMKELRLQLEAAREHSTKCTATVEQLQDEVLRHGTAEREARACNQKLREEVDALHVELENSKSAAKQQIEREKQSTRQFQQRCEAQEAQIRVLEAALKDATQARSHSRGPPMSQADTSKAVHEKPSPRLAVREATRSGTSARDDHRHHHHGPRAETRSASASLPRKLFAHGNATDDGASMVNPSTLPARYVPVSAGTASHSVSASQLPVAAPPRPTPRGGPSVSAGPGGSHAPTVQTWSARSHYTSGQSISLPTHGQHVRTASPRPGTASPRPACHGHAPHHSHEPSGERRPAVRALVSEFERRSSSQTPGVPPRSADPSPSRSGTGQLTPRVHSVTATARHISPQKRELEPAESPHSEDNSHAQLIIGMSPMQRAMPLRTSPVGLAASSPGPGPSVQDRIRQLYGGG